MPVRITVQSAKKRSSVLRQRRGRDPTEREREIVDKSTPKVSGHHPDGVSRRWNEQDRRARQDGGGSAPLNAKVPRDVIEAAQREILKD